MSDKKESDMYKSERKTFQVEGTSLVCQGTERKISLIGREGQIIQGFINQEIEFGFYSQEALSRTMRSHPSQKAVAEVRSILGVRTQNGQRNRSRKKNAGQDPIFPTLALLGKFWHLLPG